MKVYELSQIQSDYILDMPLKRLTKYSTIEIEKEKSELESTIKALKSLLKDPEAQAQVVIDELHDVSQKFGTKRRTTFDDDVVDTTTSLEIANETTRVVMTSHGLISRLRPDVKVNAGKRAKHDVIISDVETTTHGLIGVITTTGKLHTVDVIDIPLNLQEKANISSKTAIASKDFLQLARGEKILCLIPVHQECVVALGTKFGVVKRVKIEAVSKVGSQNIITLEEDDKVVGAALSHDESDELIFITQDSQLLHYKAQLVRPQGKTAAGMAGITLYEGDEVIHFAVTKKDALVITGGGDTSALPGGQMRSLKFTELKDFPAKGRATMGVNCHSLKRGENRLIFAATAIAPLRAAGSGGQPLDLEIELSKRDATGGKFSETLVSIVGERS
jgi:DNA gyrase subunit A